MLHPLPSRARESSLACAAFVLAFAVHASAQSSASAKKPGATSTGTVTETVTETITETITKATAEYAAKNFARALELYSAALARGAIESTVPYNAACCAALCGETGRAFAMLRESFELGWMDLAHLERDRDLASLRGDPRWDAFRATLREAQRQRVLRWSGEAFRVRASEPLTSADKAIGVSRVWAEVKFNFVNFHLVPELDWDAEYVAAMRAALSTESEIEYYRVLQALVAKLEDGHTNVYLPLDLARRHDAQPALRTAYVEGKVLVARVMNPALAKLGVARGQEIVAIDGVPVEEYARKRIRRYVCASTAQSRDRISYESFLLRGLAGSELRLELREPDGSKLEARVKRVAGGGMLARFLSRPEPFAMKVLDGKIAHVRLNSFSSNAALESFQKAFDELTQTEGMILDLRANGGGNSSVGRRILAYLSEGPIPVTSWHTLQYRPVYRAWKRRAVSRFGASGRAYAGRRQAYTKPVVMLIGPETFSAAEDMAASFDMLDRGELIGAPTGGSTGQPLFFDLPGGGRARVCTKHDAYADGTEFVGIGIQPDIVVEPSVEDFRKGYDRALEVARQRVLRAK